MEPIEAADVDHPDFASACDDLPLWSAPFGLTLLDTVRLGRASRARAMLDHSLMRYAFIPCWLEILAPADRRPVLDEVAARLDTAAAERRCVALAIPYACFDCSLG